jgi:hypothetical protein
MNTRFLCTEVVGRKLTQLFILTKNDIGSSGTFIVDTILSPTLSDVYVSLMPRLLRYKGSSGNKKPPPRRFSTVGIVRKVPSTPNTTNPQTSPPWWCRLPLLRCGIFGYARSDVGNLFRRGWPRAHTLGLI